ncbi:hypothetical protein Ciccas_002262 [Cichlidogyrus casuarinus]|uniref:Carboxylesterase type B domain-containing protein n=1 Tax=Cichlidogyrus casuarinus TaxID=1844966 RepID=A0ABD2QHQ9_9PLAT
MTMSTFLFFACLYHHISSLPEPIQLPSKVLFYQDIFYASLGTRNPPEHRFSPPGASFFRNNQEKSTPLFYKCSNIGIIRNENCLSLNAYVPAMNFNRSVQLKPIIILHWLNSFSSFSNQNFDQVHQLGQKLTLHLDVITIILSHRLGLPGFLSLRGSPMSGNYAIFDFHAAIIWVINNGYRFHGNSSNMIFMGVDKGATLMHIYSLTDLAKRITTNVKKIILLGSNKFKVGLPSEFQADRVKQTLYNFLKKAINISEELDAYKMELELVKMENKSERLATKEKQILCRELKSMKIQQLIQLEASFIEKARANSEAFAPNREEIFGNKSLSELTLDTASLFSQADILIGNEYPPVTSYRNKTMRDLLFGFFSKNVSIFSEAAAIMFYCKSCCSQQNKKSFGTTLSAAVSCPSSS